MTNPTSNFGWQMPTSTDLVTDLPADFEVFGQAVDTSLADLKGGTTGQVLAKASNANMDFVWSADAAGISPTIFDAKGDIIAASAADTAARLAVGANNTVLTADSTTGTGLKWATPSATFSNVSITPTWDQNSNITRTNNFSGYIEVSNFIYAYWKMTATGSGTSGNQIGVTLTGIPTGADGGNHEIVSGVAQFLDSSANLAWSLAPYFVGGTSLRFKVMLSTATGTFGTTGFSGQVDSGDVIQGFVVYRKA